MQVLINFLAWMAVRVGSKVGKHCNVWATVGLSLIIPLVYVFTIVLMPYFITLERPDVYDTFRPPQRQLQLFIYAYSNIVLVVIPPVGTYCSYRKDGNSEDNTLTMHIADETPHFSNKPFQNTVRSPTRNTIRNLSLNPIQNPTHVHNPIFVDDDEVQTNTKD